MAVREEHVSTGEGLLLATLGLAPCVIVQGWGNSISEPKLLFTLVMASMLAIIALFSHKEGRLSPIIGVLLLYAATQAAGLTYTPNIGYGAMELGLTVSWLIMFIFVSKNRCNVTSWSVATLCLAIINLATTLPRILFGSDALDVVYPLGGFIGVRNALVVFSAQIVPLLLILGLTLREQRPSLRSNIMAKLNFIVLTLTIYLIIVLRTRSAWLMLLVYGAILLFVSAIKRQKQTIGVTKEFVGAATGAILLVALVPTSLQWRDSTYPYFKSLLTIAALSESHGRDSLWNVALSMIAKSPWIGWGTGSYPPLWPAFIENSAEAPSTFGFLRLDLPLFNDYLQSAVELGVIPSLLFVSAFLVYPLILLGRETMNPEGAPQRLLLALLCAATSLNALVDYPFARTETSIFFMVALALLTKDSTHKGLFLSSRVMTTVLIAFSAFAFSLASVMAAAFTLRTHAEDPWDAEMLVSSARLWPYDRYFSHRHIQRLCHDGERELAVEIATARRSYWPADPEGFLMEGVILEQAGDLEGAKKAYQRGSVFVQGGNEYGPGAAAYRTFLYQLP
jgi:O-antigen ligase